MDGWMDGKHFRAFNQSLVRSLAKHLFDRPCRQVEQRLLGRLPASGPQSQVRSYESDSEHRPVLYSIALLEDSVSPRAAPPSLLRVPGHPLGRHLARHGRGRFPPSPSLHSSSVEGELNRPHCRNPDRPLPDPVGRFGETGPSMNRVQGSVDFVHARPVQTRIYPRDDELRPRPVGNRKTCCSCSYSR